MEELSKSMQIVRTFKQLMHSIKHSIGCQYKGMNLTGPQGMLIGMLAHHGKMKISDLSEKLDLSNSTVSGIVDRLERQGQVERIRCDEDRRVVYVNMTPEFKKISEERFKAIEKNIAAKISSTNQEDLDKIIEVLNNLKNALDAEVSILEDKGEDR